MASRRSLFVFRRPTLTEFREAMERVVTKLGGQLDWDSHPPAEEAALLTSHAPNTHAAVISTHEHEIASGVAEMLGIVWMHLRIQEGALWDYSLYDGRRQIHNFSTLPEYWDDEPSFIERHRGNPEELARLWELPQSTIERYLKPWGYVLDKEDGIFETKLRGKAYPTDECEYGQIWQMADFLRALGVQYPGNGPPHGTSRKLTFAK